jgi:glycosyltransferase involved in cell wall biosynthesis
MNQMNLHYFYPDSDRKILIIGPYPPPLGGISVYIKRLLRLMEKEAYNVELFNTSEKCAIRGLNLLNLFKLLLHKHFDVVHLHSSDIKKILFILLLKPFRRYELIFTDHNPRLFINRRKIEKWILKQFFKKLDCLIVVKEHVLDGYRENSISLPEKLLIQNAFLPPPFEEEADIIETYSEETKKFIFNHDPFIVANAFEIVFYDGVDLYGLDMCIKLTYELKKDFPNIGFLYAIANEKANSAYLKKMIQAIRHLGIEKHFHFLTGQKELWPLFKKADLSIRPTFSDGDALSIREALHFGCPVIASDKVPRPEGTILFKSRQNEDLYQKAYSALIFKIEEKI